MRTGTRKDQEKQVENLGFMLRRHLLTLSPGYSGIASERITEIWFREVCVEYFLGTLERLDPKQELFTLGECPIKLVIHAEKALVPFASVAREYQDLTGCQVRLCKKALHKTADVHVVEKRDFRR